MANVVLRFQFDSVGPTVKEVTDACSSTVSLKYVAAGRIFDHTVDDAVANAIEDAKEYWKAFGATFLAQDPVETTNEAALANLMSLGVGDVSQQAGPTLVDEVAIYGDAAGELVKPSGIRLINGALCIPLVNQTGAALVVGDVMDVDAANAQSVVLGTVGTILFAGLVAEAAAIGATTWLAIVGEATALCNGVVAIGDIIDTSVTAGEGHSHAGGVPQAWGVALTAKAGAPVGAVQVLLMKEVF